MLQRLRAQRLLDLRPPVAAALQRDEVLPDGKIVRFELLAQCRGINSAVFARI